MRILRGFEFTIIVVKRNFHSHILKTRQTSHNLHNKNRHIHHKQFFFTFFTAFHKFYAFFWQSKLITFNLNIPEMKWFCKDKRIEFNHRVISFTEALNVNMLQLLYYSKTKEISLLILLNNKRYKVTCYTYISSLLVDGLSLNDRDLHAALPMSHLRR